MIDANVVSDLELRIDKLMHLLNLIGYRCNGDIPGLTLTEHTKIDGKFFERYDCSIFDGKVYRYNKEHGKLLWTMINDTQDIINSYRILDALKQLQEKLKDSDSNHGICYHVQNASSIASFNLQIAFSDLGYSNTMFPVESTVHPEFATNLLAETHSKTVNKFSTDNPYGIARRKLMQDLINYYTDKVQK